MQVTAKTESPRPSKRRTELSMEARHFRFANVSRIRPIFSMPNYHQSTPPNPISAIEASMA